MKRRVSALLTPSSLIVQKITNTAFKGKKKSKEISLQILIII